MHSLIDKLKQIKSQAQLELKGVATEDALNRFKGKFIGKKGLLSAAFKEMVCSPPDERREVGKLYNELKSFLEGEIARLYSQIKQQKLDAAYEEGFFDVTLPGRKPNYGRNHPITTVMEEIKSIFLGLGFSVAHGPEVELDYYNFEALNMPPDHPARDMQDTFYVENGNLLRTHTSSIQIRTMERQKPPVRIIAPGKVYRCDKDVTHTPMFHQVEGLLVDKGISFADLKGVLEVFVKLMFGTGTALRFRPSFFPYTEPSAEVDIKCVVCGGAGCRVCSQSGWLEILGCGMVDPEVYKFVGYDPETYTGFAFGMGVERISMLKFGIPDIRLFFENDLRFLRQF